MELVANVWPVVDEDTGIVQRFFMRAYAIDAPDEVILATLRALAPNDFRVASVFVVPPTFVLVSQIGSFRGAVEIGAFHERRDAIIEHAFRDLEHRFARVQGIADNGQQSRWADNVVPRFPANPYLLVTSLLELEDGRLLPQLPG